MISKVNEGASLEEIRVGLNEVVNLLVWKNPLAEVEKATKQHLEGYDRRLKAQIAEELRRHNKEITDTREDLKKVLGEVKKELENLKELKKEIINYKKEIKEDLSKSIEGIFEQQKEFETKVIAQQKELKKEITGYKEKIKEDLSKSVEGIVKQQKEFEKEITGYKKEIKENQKEFEKDLSKSVNEKLDVISDIQEVVNKSEGIISQFINFYAQVGLHVGGLCDGKK